MDPIAFAGALLLLGGFLLMSSAKRFAASPLASLTVTSGFGPRGTITTGGRTLPAHFHAGIDLRASVGTPYFAVDAGTVEAIERAAGVGKILRVRLDRGERVSYIHVDTIDVSMGDRVAAGQRLGTTGDGDGAVDPHLHLEVKDRGASSSRNPAPFLGLAA
jgi:murein DD-endopeptidase MepM/ murein hydrolase activator NlpD